MKIFLTGIKGEPDRDFLALLEWFASGFLGGDHEQLDLSEAELVIGLVKGRSGTRSLTAARMALETNGEQLGRFLLELLRRNMLSSVLASRRPVRS